MSDLKLDPRVVRTRALLIEAMTQLIYIKDIKEISIKDITELATVNRATLYAHFKDKYELMDAALTHVAREQITEPLLLLPALDEQAIKKILNTLMLFHEEMIVRLAPQCQADYYTYESIIHTIIKRELQSLLAALLQKHCSYLGALELHAGSNILSSSICTASLQKFHYPDVSIQRYIAYILPFIASSEQYS